jgi:glucose/arabinose dehydrogenase
VLKDAKFVKNTSMRKLAFFLFSLAMIACKNDAPATDTQTSTQQNSAGITVPEGFKAEIYADNLGAGRHLAIGKAGDIYARLAVGEEGKSIVAMRDTNADGKVDITEYFEELAGGTGIKVHNNYLYFSTNEQVFRRAFKGNELVPTGERELVLTLPSQNQHEAKPLAFDAQDSMYITIGAPSNACQDPDRQPGVVGQDPCPLLETSGGIWKFSASKLNQTFADGKRYATGIRHAVGITFNSKDQKLYAMQHGRDQLHEFWPDIYSEKESSEQPAEEFLRIEPDSDFGWPYCYFDWKKRTKFLNPEYGGNSDSIGRCVGVDYPLMGFPGHWAPNALEFYQGNQFPVSYKGGAFIAFHGSWNRAPFPQQGYRVVFVPFSGNDPISGYTSFATGFAGVSDDPSSPADAKYRPCGLAVDQAGALYILDSREGRVWRVTYQA